MKIAPPALSPPPVSCVVLFAAISSCGASCCQNRARMSVCHPCETRPESAARVPGLPPRQRRQRRHRRTSTTWAPVVCCRVSPADIVGTTLRAVPRTVTKQVFASSTSVRHETATSKTIILRCLRSTRNELCLGERLPESRGKPQHARGGRPTRPCVGRNRAAFTVNVLLLRAARRKSTSGTARHGMWFDFLVLSFRSATPKPSTCGDTSSLRVENCDRA